MLFTIKICTDQASSLTNYKIYFQDPKQYVNTILDVHKKYNTLVLTAFANDSGFVASLDKACGKFINNNSVTKKANASTKSPGI